MWEYTREREDMVFPMVVSMVVQTVVLMIVVVPIVVPMVVPIVVLMVMVVPIVVHMIVPLVVPMVVRMVVPMVVPMVVAMLPYFLFLSPSLGEQCRRGNREHTARAHSYCHERPRACGIRNGTHTVMSGQRHTAYRREGSSSWRPSVMAPIRGDT